MRFPGHRVVKSVEWVKTEVDDKLLDTAFQFQNNSTMGPRHVRLLSAALVCVVLSPCPFQAQLLARTKKDAIQYGAGLTVNIPSPEAEVLKAVDEVVENGKIRGTKEYAKDEFVGGAKSVADSPVFPAWTEGGKIFYKQRTNVLDPRNFKDTNDVGTLAVRYVVVGQDDKHTVLRIDAVFVETFRRKSHASDGSVEAAEYKEIHDQLDSMQAMRDQAAAAERAKQQTSQTFPTIANASAPASTDPASSVNSIQPKETSPRPQEEISPAPQETIQSAEPAVSTAASIDDLKKRLHDLQQQTERRVKAPGTALKSAPFHTATSLQTLREGTDVLIVVSTTYWLGVETHEGQHGWIFRDDLEELP